MYGEKAFMIETFALQQDYILQENRNLVFFIGMFLDSMTYWMNKYYFTNKNVGQTVIEGLGPFNLGGNSEDVSQDECIGQHSEQGVQYDNKQS